MKEIEEFNMSVIESHTDNIQYGFSVPVSRSERSKKKLVNSEIAAGLKMFYVSMKQAMTARPLPREDFKGIKNGDVVHYQKLTVVPFPYRVAFLVYEIGGVRYYKMGIQIVNYKTEK